MKKKQVMMVLGIALCMTSYGIGSVWAEETEALETEQTAELTDTGSDTGTQVENAVWGEVVSVSEESVKILVGIRKDMVLENPAGNAETPESEELRENEEISDNENQSGNAQKEPGQQPSILELTGDEQEIVITGNTVIKKQGMGQPDGGQGNPQGEMLTGENGEEPEKPAGENGEVLQKPAEGNGEVPEKPSGEGMLSNGMPGEMEKITWEDIQEGDMVSITLDEEGNAAEITVISMEMGGMGHPGGGQAGQPDSYETVKEYTEDATAEGETYASTGTDENAVLISGGTTVTIKDAEIIRNSGESTGGDASSFYGVGAALLAADGNAYVRGGTVQTDASGGAGLFAYGTGTVYASDTVITTEKDTSGGIHVAGGGTLYAWDLDVETQGESSAAIRSDRGGGRMIIDGGSYTSNGSGSPAIYSTADIAVKDAVLTANGSEAICIEGLNSIHLYHSDLTGNMSDDERNEITWNVILYQSMSGDSEVGNSTFEMNGGTLTAGNGGMFYTTNTESTFILSDVDITYAKDSDFFLQCTGNANQRGWGQSGANGADCLFTGISQEMQGDVIWDSISNLDLYLTEGSTLTGAVVNDETYAGNGGVGYCNLYISEDSAWTVIGDSMVSALQCDGTITDTEGNLVTVQGTDGTVYVEGSSEYTVTVGSYQNSADLTGASSATAWSAFETVKPVELS
ncbi:MAG: hypothetical protein Q4C59_08925 [Lachnospiraceae bacterium]|nr:hypothetical protein [Lachnospiraceae bacterium]